ncbi:MAG: LamG domain-containing protein [Nitrospirae bacterium]|nr:MAG: LamG domain-containing protein [Nitrospirota bacterium]
MKKIVLKGIVSSLSLLAMTALALILSPTPAQAASRTGLVGWWNLDNSDINGLNVLDRSGKGHNGTSVGTPTKVAGKVNGAVSFNGTSDYVYANSVYDTNGQSYTISGWIKMASSSPFNNMAIMSISDGGSWALFPNGGFLQDSGARTITATHYTGSAYKSVNSVVSLPLNQWSFIVVTYNSSAQTMSFYVDGVNRQSATSVAPPGQSYSNFQIGGTLNNNPNIYQYFQGSLDDVRVYNRALSAAEVKQLYDSAKTNYARAASRNGLVGYWTMDSNDMNGTKVYDKSGGGNNGTLVNSPTLSTGKISQSVLFNGSNQYITKSSPSYIDNTQGTLSAWFKVASLTGIDTLWTVGVSGAINDNLRVDYRGDSSKVLQIILVIDGAVSFNAVTVNTISDFNWHLISATSDGSTFKVYIDGVLQSLTINSGSNTGQWFDDAIDANTFTMGRLEYDSPIQYFNGSIDDARVYNRALSAAEVKNLYNAGKVNYVQAAPKAGLVGYWNMNNEDRSRNLIYDKSGFNNNGILFGTTTSTGKIKEARSFNGSSDYIYAVKTASLDIDSRITMSAWIYPTNVPSVAAIIEKDYNFQGYGIYINNGTVHTGVFNGSDTFADGGVIITNQWNHVAGTYDGSNIIAYVNGVQVASTPRTGAIGVAQSGVDLGIGVWYDAGAQTLSRYFQGRIDEARVYNRALSAAEMKQLYNAAKVMYVK